MNNFTYYVPTKVFFGKDQEKNVGKIIKEYGFKKVMLHYGTGSIKKNGLYDLVVNSLKENDIEYVDFGGVTPNPKLSLVLEGVKICKEQNIELILAVGGGSVIDSAKSIADGAKVEFSPWEFQIKKEAVKAALPIGSILTLSAAGSEMSQSCVITNDQTKEKRGVNSQYHRILFAIENPELSYSVDKFQTGCGIVDIMMHTMERYYSVNDNTELTDNLCLALLKSVVSAGRVAIENPNDYEARATLMWASSLSHNDLTGCGKEYVMPAHQIEHEISGMFDHIAHGAGLSVIFPAWAKYVYKSDIDRFYRFAVEVMNLKPSKNKEKVAYKGIIALEEFYKEIGMPVRLSELNVKEEAFKELAENYTFKGTRTLKDRIEIGYQEALDILYLAK